MITSTKNEWVIRTKALLENRERRERGLFLLEGDKLLEEALGAGLRFAWALVDPDWERARPALAAELRRIAAPERQESAADEATERGRETAAENRYGAGSPAVSGRAIDGGRPWTTGQTKEEPGYGAGSGAPLEKRGASSATEAAPRILAAERRVIAAATGLKAPQGIAAVFHMPEQRLRLQAGGLYVALDGIQDPGNLGTVLRTCDALALDGALLSPACADPFSLKSLRGGMGAAFRVRILRGELAPLLREAKERGLAVIAGDLGAPDFFARGPLPGGAVLAVGSEGRGVSAEVRMEAQAYSLPMPGGAESLNAAVAAGIMLYDLWRNRA